MTAALYLLLLAAIVGACWYAYEPRSRRDRVVAASGLLLTGGLLVASAIVALHAA